MEQLNAEGPTVNSNRLKEGIQNLKSDSQLTKKFVLFTSMKVI